MSRLVKSQCLFVISYPSTLLGGARVASPFKYNYANWGRKCYFWPLLNLNVPAYHNYALSVDWEWSMMVRATAAVTKQPWEVSWPLWCKQPSTATTGRCAVAKSWRDIFSEFTLLSSHTNWKALNLCANWNVPLHSYAYDKYFSWVYSVNISLWFNRSCALFGFTSSSVDCLFTWIRVSNRSFGTREKKCDIKGL